MSPNEVLAAYFRHRQFRPDQEAIIQRTIDGGSSLVIMPTGAGKSLCYQIPAICHAKSELDLKQNPDRKPVLTVVLSPLIALMKDQVDALEQKGVPATFINSSLDRIERERRYDQIAQGDHILIYVTPERFRKDPFIQVLKQRHVALLAVDEAHCISEWGHDFRPDYTRVGELRSIMGNPTTIALTATATSHVQNDIVHQLGLKRFGEQLHECKLFHSGIGRPNLQLDVREVWGMDEKIDAIQENIGELLQAKDRGSGIVYFTLIRTLQEASERLSRLKVAHVCYHGDLSRSQRKGIQEQFMSGQSSVVLATNAFGMGIDKEDIRFVIHAETPNSIESYYQEIGRAGRDGKPSRCVLLYDQRDLQTQMEFLRWSNPDADFYQRTFDLLVHEVDSVRAFGIEWLREKLCNKNRTDRRLETVLGMLHRYDLIEDENDLSNVTVTGPMPATLASSSDRQEKLLRDQKKLYAVVEYARAEAQREFIETYFAP